MGKIFTYGWLLFLILLATDAQAVPGTKGLSYFSDPTLALTVDDLIEGGDLLSWEPVSREPLRFGVSGSRHWIRFQIAEEENSWERETLILEIPFQYLERAALYGVDNGKIFFHSETGTAVPFSKRRRDDLETAVLNFRLVHGRPVGAVYYLSIEGSMPLTVPLNLQLARDFIRRNMHKQLFLGVFMGFLAMALVFNGFLAVALKSRLYLYYTCFVASLFFLFAGHEGFTILYLWQESPGWATKEMHFYGGLSVFFYALFVRAFLETPKWVPGLDKLLLIFVLVSSIRAVWLMFQPNQMVLAIGEAAVVGTNLLALTMAIVALLRGARSARFFLFSSLAFNAGLAAYIFQETNLIHLGSWVDRAPHIGAAIEIALLSLALADRIRLTNRDLATSNLSLAEEMRERVRAEHALEAQRSAVIHAEKMSALGRMAGGIAHEINNPLAIIHGNAVLLKGLVKDGSQELKNVAETIEQTCLRISRVVKSMRSLVREVRSDPLENVKLNSIMADAEELCRDRFQEGGVKLDIPLTEEDVYCRSSEICQVLVNLLNNAFDAALESQEKWVRVEAQRRNGKIFVSVIDSGAGPPKESIGRLFEPFYSSKEVGKGTGLGLSISRSIIENHGESIWFDGSGPHTRFTFTLPLAKESKGA